MMKRSIVKKISKYRFEFRHILVLLVILISFQIILSFIQKSSLKDFLDNASKRTKRIILAIPDFMDDKKIIEKNWEIKNRFEIYLHKSLTKIIYVLNRI